MPDGDQLLVWGGGYFKCNGHGTHDLKPCGYLGESVSGSGNHKCKGPEVGMCLVHSRNSKEDSVAGVWGARGSRAEDEVGEGTGEASLAI